MATENTEAASDNFAEWLAHEMPPGTVINNPRWWAPRIAAHFAAGQQGKAGGVAGVFDSVRENLRFFADCAEDGDGCPLPRHWFDALTTIGLLERTKRSPAEWMMTSAGHDLLASPPPPPPPRRRGECAEAMPLHRTVRLSRIVQARLPIRHRHAQVPGGRLQWLTKS